MFKLKQPIWAIVPLLASLSLKAQTDSVITERLSIHAQTTIINQFKPAFTAKYSGDNSLLTNKESKTSITSTLYIGAKLWKGASLFINPEIAGGSGLSEALGIAAATNGETFRIGDPAPQVYLARLFYTQVFALTNQTTYQASNFNQIAEYLPNKYFAVTIGKIGAADAFDNNQFSHDPRTQFMSWGLMSNGAWDYPANTSGYTPSIVLAYISPKHELRYGFSLVPLLANGNDMNWDVAKANSQMLEYTKHYTIKKQAGTIKLLGFLTTANMGNYQQSLAQNPLHPNIENVRQNGNTKFGFAVNIAQNFSNNLGGFFRAGWNDGKNETWMFTEIDRSLSAGVSLKGQSWKRENDNIGLAYVASGISKNHSAYLKAGGAGFILGDGNLNYGWEHLAELYYSAELNKNHIYLTGTYQFVINPGYNIDRQGPINIFSVRLHARM